MTGGALKSASMDDFDLRVHGDNVGGDVARDNQVGRVQILGQVFWQLASVHF